MKYENDLGSFFQFGGICMGVCVCGVDLSVCFLVGGGGLTELVSVAAPAGFPGAGPGLSNGG